MNRRKPNIFCKLGQQKICGKSLRTPSCRQMRNIFVALPMRGKGKVSDSLQNRSSTQTEAKYVRNWRSSQILQHIKAFLPGGGFCAHGHKGTPSEGPPALSLSAIIALHSPPPASEASNGHSPADNCAAECKCTTTACVRHSHTHIGVRGGVHFDLCCYPCFCFHPIPPLSFSPHMSHYSNSR